MATTPTLGEVDTTALQKTATSQVNSEVAGSEAPIQGQINTVSENEKGALQGLGDLFKGLMPYVQASAEAVKESEEFGAGVQKSIFDTASLQLNQMAQARAQEAQALAQQMGGPVDMTEFGKALAPTLATMPETFAGAQLNALAQGQVSTNEAEAFAGKVFPLVETEQTKEMTQFFENKKSDLQNQIAALEAEKPGLINTRLNELTTQERQWQLDKANFALSKLSAAHDWTVSKTQLKQEQEQIDITKKQLGLDVAGVTGTYQGKPTQAAKKQSADIAAQKQATALNNQELAVKEKQTAMALAENITSSGAPTTYYSSVKLEVPTPLPGTKGVYVMVDAKGKVMKNKDGSTRYYTIVNTKQTTASSPKTSDPDEVYNYLLANGISATTALGTVRAQLGNQKWNPGEKSKSSKTTTTQLSKNDLAQKTVAQLQSIAKRMGYKKNTSNRSTLTNWIMGQAPTDYTNFWGN